MKKIINLFVLLLIIAGISSCVEEDPFFDPDDVENVIEFKSAGNVQSPVLAPYPLFVNAYDIAPEQSMDIVVSYSGADVAPTDITVNIGLGTEAMLDAYNESEETEYTMLPANLYTLPTSITIPQGERTVTYSVKLATNQFDVTENYALPLTITSASSGIISGNFGSAIFAVSAKNQWDGNYTVEATAPMVDMTSPTLTGYYPLNADLVTTGGNSVKMFTYTYLEGYEGHPIKSGTASSYYGNFAPVFTMDDAGNVTGVTNFYGQGTNTSTRAARLNPDGVNKFTINSDGSKVLEVSYIMVQGGVDRTFFHEKWTFQGER